jgi:hypothetical protein
VFLAILVGIFGLFMSVFTPKCVKYRLQRYFISMSSVTVRDSEA